jgi:hypothetical protein
MGRVDNTQILNSGEGYVCHIVLCLTPNFDSSYKKNTGSYYVKKSINYKCDHEITLIDVCRPYIYKPYICSVYVRGLYIQAVHI